MPRIAARTSVDDRTTFMTAKELTQRFADNERFWMEEALKLRNKHFQHIQPDELYQQTAENLERSPGLRDVQNVDGYIHVTMKRVGIRLNKKKSRQIEREIQQDRDLEAMYAASKHRTALEREDQSTLFLSAFRPYEAEILRLLIFERKSVAEVSEILGKPLTTVYSHLKLVKESAHRRLIELARRRELAHINNCIEYAEQRGNALAVEQLLTQRAQVEKWAERLFRLFQLSAVCCERGREQGRAGRLDRAEALFARSRALFAEAKVEERHILVEANEMLGFDGELDEMLRFKAGGGA